MEARCATAASCAQTPARVEVGGMGLQAIVGDHRSLTNALLSISIATLQHVLVAVVKLHWEGFRPIVDGTPIVIIENGRWNRNRIDKLLLHEQDIMAAAREPGV
jgi:uncharacterized membrane protein YcaP (DUF421 family)